MKTVQCPECTGSVAIPSIERQSAEVQCAHCQSTYRYQLHKTFCFHCEGTGNVREYFTFPRGLAMIEESISAKCPACDGFPSKNHDQLEVLQRSPDAVIQSTRASLIHMRSFLHKIKQENLQRAFRYKKDRNFPIKSRREIRREQMLGVRKMP